MIKVIISWGAREAHSSVLDTWHSSLYLVNIWWTGFLNLIFYEHYYDYRVPFGWSGWQTLKPAMPSTSIASKPVLTIRLNFIMLMLENTIGGVNTLKVDGEKEGLHRRCLLWASPSVRAWRTRASVKTALTPHTCLHLCTEDDVKVKTPFHNTDQQSSNLKFPWWIDD